MNVARWRDGDGAEGWAVVGGDGSLRRLDGHHPTTASLLVDGTDEMCAGGGALIASDSVQIVSPVTVPCQIVAQGINYRSHRRESGLDPDDRRHNVMFRKSWVSACGPTDDIVRPRHVRLLDYEIELGLVLRATIDTPRAVEPADLPELVGALVMANDVSARDVQLPEGQWYRAKSYRTFTPLGPYLFVPDARDWDRLTELELRLSVNDELRQRAAVDDMVFGPAESLADLSHWEVLAPGDVLLTGTPGGVALRPPRSLVQRLAGLLPDTLRWDLFVAGQLRRREYLQPGDLVHATIATLDGAIDLGAQRNRVVAG